MCLSRSSYSHFIMIFYRLWVVGSCNDAGHLQRGSWNMVTLKQQNKSFNLNLFVCVLEHKCAQTPQHALEEVSWGSWFSSATYGSQGSHSDCQIWWLLYPPSLSLPLYRSVTGTKNLFVQSILLAKGPSLKCLPRVYFNGMP